ncbi:MAG: flagellar basal body-associated FliL family protein [Methylococcales bacterium]
MSEAKSEEGEVKKSSKKKLIIIIVAVLVLLAGGGGAAYYFLKVAPAKDKSEHGAKTEGADQAEHGDDKESSAHDEEASAEHDDAKDNEEHGDEHGDGAVHLEMLYYDMGKPFVVSLPQGSGAKLVSVSISVSVEDQEAVDALKKHEPMIRNNLMMLIGAQKTEDLKTREGKEQLRDAMLKAIIEVLKKKIGKAHVSEVFFTAFVMQ